MSDLPIGWTVQRLGDAGGFFARRVDGYAGVRPYLATSDVNQGTATPSGEFTYSERPARADLLLNADDVLQAKMKGTDKAFLVGATQSGWLASTGFAQFNPLAVGSSPRFLLHVLSSRWFIEAKDARCVGSTQQAISDKELADITIATPPHMEQSRIADVLDAIDSAIHETEAIIAKLRAVKHGLLHDLLTRGIDANGELRPPHAEAPHLYKSSPLGRIPLGWDCQRLSTLATKIVDGVHQTPRYVTTGIPFVTIRNLTESQDISFTSLNYISESDHREFRKRADPKPGDVLVTKDGTLGVARLVKDYHPEFSIFVSVALIRADSSRLTPEILLAFFDSGHYKSQIGAQSGGSGLKHIHLEQFRNFEIPVPPVSEQGLICEMLMENANCIAQEEEQLRALSSIRAGLMDDLLTGRVRVTPLLEGAAA